MNKALLLNLIVCFTLTACGGGGGGSNGDSPTDNGNGKDNISDFTPDDFFFLEASNHETSAEVISNEITLSGLSLDTPISVENGLYSVNGATPITEASTVTSGDTVKVFLTTSAEYQTTTTATISVGTLVVDFNATTRSKDISPEAFNFTAISNAELNTGIPSNQITLSGIDSDTPISITFGSYQINDALYTNEGGLVKSGDVISVLLNSGSDYASNNSANLTVGDYTNTFTVSTRDRDSTPDSFSFVSDDNVEPATLTSSNTITLSGFDNDTSISIVNGFYSLNGGDFTSQTASQLNSGDTLAVQVLSSVDFKGKVAAVVSVGTISVPFNVTTRSKNITPAEFEFTHIDGSDPSISNISNTISLSGIDSKTEISITEGMYSINSGEFTNEVGQVNEGDTLAIQVSSSSKFETLTIANVTVGDFTTSYQVTTRQKDTNPNYTVPMPVANAAINTEVESVQMTFTEFDGDEIVVTGAEYSINNGEWQSAGNALLANNDKITLRILSSAEYESQVSASVGGNGWLFMFQVTTGEDTAPTVSFNKAFAEDGSTPLGGNEELILTFSETMQIDTLTLSDDMLPNCNDQADTTSCLNLIWSENNTVLTLSPKDDFYWYADVRVLKMTITGDGILGLDESVSATVLPVFETFQAADVVIGQVDLHSNRGGVTDNTLYVPVSISVYTKDNNSSLLITDRGNHRILKHVSIPTEHQADHDLIFGNTSFNSDERGISDSKISDPRAAIELNDNIYIADQYNRRAMLIESENFSAHGGNLMSGKATSLVGQSDFTSKSEQCTRSGLSGAHAMEVVETPTGIKWIVADQFHDRIMIWNNPDETMGAEASIVLGQDSFDICDRDGDSLTKGLKSIEHPMGIWSNGEKLVVSSVFDNRLLIWNSFPTENNQEPSFQLGQLNNTDYSSNAGKNTNQRGFAEPYAIGGNKHQMCVADNVNSRVLIWSKLPESSDDLADVVIGQSDFEKHTPNDIDQDGSIEDTIDGKVLDNPASCDISMEQLFIADTDNNRVLIYNALNKYPENN